MTTSIAIDGSGRMVVPKALREQMQLNGAGHLQVELVAGQLRGNADNGLAKQWFEARWLSPAV